MARSGAVSAVLILLTVMAAAPAEARQRGGVVDVIPPDEVERIFQQGDCGHAHATDEDVRFFSDGYRSAGSPTVPNSIMEFWRGSVTVDFLFDIDSDNRTTNARITRYTYHDRARHFTRGQRQVLEAELLDCITWERFETASPDRPLTGCHATAQLTVR